MFCVPEEEADSRAGLVGGEVDQRGGAGTEDPSSVYIDKAFRVLAEKEARNHGRQPRECPDADLRAAHYADAWDECGFHLGPFVSTYVYESLPSSISQLLVLALEGRASVKNRLLQCPGPGLVFDLLFRTWWPLLLMFLLWRPPGCHAINVAVAGLLFSFRNMCIAMKYAYLPESDQRLIRTFSGWRSNNHVFRNLGVAVHFNVGDTFEIDVMKEIMTAALRADVLDELRSRCFDFTPLGARRVWEPVRLALAKFGDDGRLKALVASKFGNTQASIGLADVDAIEGEVSQGRLRAGVLAYYLALREYGPTSKGLLAALMPWSLAMASVRPLLRFLFEDTSDGTAESTAFQCLLFWTEFNAIFFFNVYLLYVVLDAKKRAQICQAMLASIGHREVRADRLVRGFEDIALPLKTVDDMLAFWAAQRVLGPELFRSLSIRYSSGYVLVGVVHLLALSGVLLFLDAERHEMGIIYSIGGQVATIFLVGAVNVGIGAVVAQGANTSVTLVQKVMRRAGLNSVLLIKRRTSADAAVHDGKVEDLSSMSGLLNGNFEEVAPVKILYMPASSEIVTSIIAAFGFLAHSVFKHLLSELHTPEVVLEMI
mmetsp:Transcript_48726/g.98173  ORF Transcript_48726/g.98173 Transcript_48726/m.98173 type:complete len:599 (-) Transcript_48726:170-1966(-)